MTMLTWLMSTSLVLLSAGLLFLLMGCSFLVYCKGDVIFDSEVLSCYVKMQFGVYFNMIGVMFSFLVATISGVVFIYVLYYMRDDKSLKRFSHILCVFIMSMLLLVSSGSLVFLMLGWDGLGLSSYGLVIYYMNSKSENGGMLTYISNRVGDVFLLSLIGLYCNLGGWLYFLLYNKGDILLVMGVFVVLASMTKSAQVPFSPWLPAAMMAPTPVSSLVHSSTLVTAGVYLVVRFYDCMTSELKYILLVVGFLTMVVGGLNGFFEYDMKKIVAYSTLSQLGLMFFMLGLGMKGYVMFHLFIHAFFKSSLFMCIGYIIHENYINQDGLSGGSLWCFPVIGKYISMLNFSLMGLPFFSGWFSKELLLGCCMSGGYSVGMYTGFFALVVLTGMYSIRLMGMLYSGKSKNLVVYSMCDSGFVNMLTTILGLMVMISVCGGYFLYSFMGFKKSGYFMGLSDCFLLVICLMVVVLVYGVVESYWLCNYSSYIFTVCVDFFSCMWYFIFFFKKISDTVFNLGNLYKDIDKNWYEFYSLGLYNHLTYNLNKVGLVMSVQGLSSFWLMFNTIYIMMLFILVYKM